ncbi:PrsW family glutamic-type intramembrane protease [Streptomyces sp. JV185]|uniref:PrsW family glutamic-type intramembrane protease n=1 Tax=Streptomyces sp. JV185 TaxID=858638 RepID=UPI002E75AB2F|nr:PrsW family glutamic-type intramembrane protease [Streptomyces sp. JV185]MEE1774141.1 PrsW family glutamic-type intramembrane protease [Streptomyces sp. JV185]
MRAGLVLGATVGFGFAAFESAGYAFNAAAMKGIDLRALLETEVPRGVLAPFGHGLRTAIAGGVLLSFRKPNGRFRFAAPVIGTCLGVAVLHSLRDSTHGIAIRLVARITDTTDTGLSRALFAQGYIPGPHRRTAASVHPLPGRRHRRDHARRAGLAAVSGPQCADLRDERPAGSSHSYPLGV